MAAVVLLHAFMLAAARVGRLKPPRSAEEALTVTLLAERYPVHEARQLVPATVQLIAPVPVNIVADTAAIAIPVMEEPAPTHPTRNVTTTTAIMTPTNLGTPLEVQCPQRTPPRYPPLAKRQREQGEVRLRVELDATGRIDRITVIGSSGSPRLDEAARAAVESWHCRPAERDGQPVRAVALQSLAFVLERH